MEVEHASTNSRDGDTENNDPGVPDQGIQDSAVKQLTVTLRELFSATRLKFPSSRSVFQNDIPSHRKQASQA